MNEKVIWDFLQSRTKNAYGTAALMGNLMAESSLNPLCVTGSKDPDYVSKADSGKIDFVHDSHAFGLAQWCYYTRKEGLLNYAKTAHKSIGDLELQLNYLIDELSIKYKTVWAAITQAKDIRTASDIIMLKYEKPANVSETMKQKRAGYGKKFFDMFSPDNLEKKEQKTAQKRVVITTDRVNIRAGNGTNFPRISQVNKNAMYEWVATSENKWHAIKMLDKVAWVSGEFSKLI